MEESVRDKSKGILDGREKPKKNTKLGSSEQTDQLENKLQSGKIFEESTKSISSMTKDMQETASIVSLMKKELAEKRNRIADLIATGNPFSDSFKTSTDMSVVASPHTTITDLKTNVQPDQRFYSNQLYDLISSKLDMVIEQNKEVIKLLNFKTNDDDSVLP